MVEWEEDQKFGRENLLWDTQMQNYIGENSQHSAVCPKALSQAIWASDVLRLQQETLDMLPSRKGWISKHFSHENSSGAQSFG